MPRRSSYSGQVWCYGCAKWIDRNNFYKNKARVNGLDSRCKPCSVARTSIQRVATDKKREETNRKQREWNKRRRQEAIRHYTNGTMRCMECGFADERALTFDHIDGGGSEHRKKVGEGTTFVQWLHRNKFPTGYQVLCMNCNFIKRVENGEVGGRKEWKTRRELKYPTPPKSEFEEF